MVGLERQQIPFSVSSDLYSLNPRRTKLTRRDVHSCVLTIPDIENSRLFRRVPKESFLGGPFLNLIEFIIDPGELHMRGPLPSAHRRESVLSEMPNMEARYALLTYGWPPISIWLFASWEGERLAAVTALIRPSSAPNACVSAVAAEAPPSAAETGAIVRGGSALWVTGGSAGCETSSRRRHLPGFSLAIAFVAPLRGCSEPDPEGY